MPELPEVESFKNFLERHALGKVIQGADAANRFMLQGITRQDLEKALKGNSFVSAWRHGKYLFIRLKKGGYMMMHFGMTGYFEFYRKGEVVPSYALLLTFPGGERFAFVDRRKFGKIALLEDPAEFITRRGYGPDALEIKSREFVEAFRSRRIAIKTALMDQRSLAGVGNEFSDQILFQAGIHPGSKANALNETQLREIFRHMQKVLKAAVKADADRDKLRKYFFLDNRRAGLPCPSACGAKTAFKTIGGRSAYFCPSCQELFH